MNQLIQKLEALSLDRITLDHEIQPRQQLNQEVVAEYAEAMKRGATFPPVVVFFDGSKYWLADGFHRIAAKQANGDLEILAEEKIGSRRDAILFAAGANVMHGLRRTNADKHRVVERLIQDSEWCLWSDNAIAQQCGVSRTLVRKTRQLTLPTCIKNKSVSRKGADGRIINISNIGKKEKAVNKDAECIQATEPNTLISIKRSQFPTKASVSQDQLTNYLKQIQFPLNFNGEQHKLGGNRTHLQIDWQYGNQSGHLQIPIHQIMLLDEQSAG
ncbi:ParB N-terminal domain-containing protein [Acaryochloris sp. CCMEE 5410]|uniref:ParB N-terminal domain-containing protein n=1 Tax=Acaryochloris sp. CCMEE 5410 TaxID=310037 RepID=UPI0011122992|nr:ParB N-terminal domain-containing protein [Acaryochloris sp. CCMEE 5410]KAI9129589.1 ParB N-terminal domain-containing protein [Acaryochloris sp. CCMEE 5410]